jgi:voltage-gated potassium channel
MGRKLETGAVSLGLLAFLLIVFAAMSILIVEQHPDSNIRTAQDAGWWAVSTITTVGYGDRYPVTGEGRVLGMTLMLMGVGMYGGLSGLVASLFLGRNDEDNDRDLQRILARLDELHAKVDRLEKTPVGPPRDRSG